MENVSHTIDTALEKTEDLQSQYQNVKERANAAMRSAQKKGNEVWDDSLEFVRKNPAQSVGIAVAAGAAIGVLAYALLTRRDTPYARFQRLTDASQDGWENIKDAMEKGISGLKSALHNVQESFK